MIKDILNNRKKLIYAIVAAVLVIAIIVTGTALILKANNSLKKTGEASGVITQTAADGLMSQAIEASKNNDNSKAKTLAEQAKKQYEGLKDVDGINDVEGFLYAIEHLSESSPEINYTDSVTQAQKDKPKSYTK